MILAKLVSGTPQVRGVQFSDDVALAKYAERNGRPAVVRRVLFVEDNETLLLVYPDAFSDDYLVTLASPDPTYFQNALDLIERARASGESFDLVIVDGDFDRVAGRGLTLIKEIRRRNFAGWIMATPGGDSVAALRPMIRAGADYGMRKPIGFELFTDPSEISKLLKNADRIRAAK